MAEASVYDEVTPTRPPTLDLNYPHRQLLRNLDGHVDSGSDVDITDDEVSMPRSSAEEEDAVGGLIGISISRAQDHMKSPTTPAAVKSQALQDSRSYFPDDAAHHEDIVEEPESLESSSADPNVSSTYEQPQVSTDNNDLKVPDRPSSQGKSDGHPNKRTSLVGSILSVGVGTRPRSSSGPNLLGSIRKMLPDVSTLSGRRESNPKSETTQEVRQTPTNSADSSRQRISEMRQLGVGLDGANESTMDKDDRPNLLRRSTSDHSLYLRRAATGASHFDDPSPFLNQSDQVNSRIKAITDTLADSSLHIPRPNVRFGPRSAARSTAELTKRNTEMNSAQALRDFDNPQPLMPGHGTTYSHENKHPILTEALSKLTGDVVIMGGYRGSILREADPPHRQLWAPLKVGLNIRKADLEVGLTREDELKMDETIIPSGTLSHIGPIDISRRLIKKLRKCHNAKMQKLRVHDWGYDWRLSPELLSAQLIKFLESLESNRSENKIESKGTWVIAHSLGGLVTRHAVNQRPELFAGVVFAGTPHHCVNILGPLRNGDDVLLSSKVLTAQVNFTLRTSFALLPDNGRCFFNKDTGERYDVDFFHPETWDTYRLSPCISPALPANSKAPRKSIVGSISETISSYTPSLPTKRSSWFGSNSNDHEASSMQDAKDKVDDAKMNVENAAKHMASVDDQVGKSLEPSMNSTSSQNRPSISTACTIPKDKACEYLARTLTEVRRFKSELAYRQELQENNKYPPHAIIYGKHTPTVYGAKVASREAIKYSDAYDNLAFAAGDGVVLASAAQLPSGYRCVKGGRVQSERGHVSLLGDLEGIGRCVNAVIDARTKGVGIGCYDDRRRKSQT